MMPLKHILIPLDGSESSEKALPMAGVLAHLSGARATLLHVLEQRPPQQVHQQRHITTVAEAHDYLAQVTARVLGQGVTAESHVHEQAVRDVARGIADHVAELEPDLVVMSTHGGSGPRQWAFGSIAQQVVAAGDTPMLLIPPAAEPLLAIQTLLVPLDGAVSHEACLPLATALAQLWRARIELFLVVPNLLDLKGQRAAISRAMPFTTAQALDIEQEAAARYLERIAATLPPITNPQYSVRRGEPVHEILAAADQSVAPVLVMSTHGRHGSKAFWAASVAPKVAISANVPILLVPVQESPNP